MTPADARRVWREVVVLNAGGTINMDAGMGAAPGDGVARLFARLGDGFDRARLRLVSPFDRPPDSSNIGAAAWGAIVAAVETVDTEKRAARAALVAAGQPLSHRGGVVIAHGTDTMQITSMVVALELAHAGLCAPVVFTGSHSPPDAPGSDAVPNLAKAIFAATLRPDSAPHNLPPGVYVLVGEDIHLAARLSKVRSSPDPDGRYFYSFPGPVAQMTSKDFSVKLDQALLDRVVAEGRRGAAPLQRERPWGAVEHLLLDAFVDPGVVDDLRARMAAIPADRRSGVVVQGDFSAHEAADQLSAGLSALAQQGVVVAVGSRKAHASLVAHQPGARGAPIVLLPRSLSHGAARTKLSWLLGTRAPIDTMADRLTSSLVGEVFETRALPSWIKYETWPDQRSGTLALSAWPDLPPAVLRDHAARLVATGPGATLHIFGFGYGHLPGPNRPLAALVRAWRDRDLPALALPESLPAGVSDLVTALTDAFSTSSPDAIEAWLLHRFELVPRLLHQACHSALASAVQDEARAALAERARALLASDPALALEGLTATKVDEAVAALTSTVRFRITPARLQAAGRARLRRAGLPDDAPLVRRLPALAPRVLARRALKDAVMAAHPLMAEVGRATDAGLRVQIHSLAARSPTDIRRYEAGTLLLALGVADDAGAWWRLEGLRPRREPGAISRRGVDSAG